MTPKVPCSWGAMYFPEHWREFHDYLDLRLRGRGPKEVVPDIPSNNWPTSWKRFFNELVFLRGYVMLYPNFDGAASLSTNHVEVGEHVGADLPAEVHAQMRKAMAVPLMTREKSLLSAGVLPQWQDLPVLDLKGYITSHEVIVQRGQAKRMTVAECYSEASTLFDAGNIFCDGL
jgi:hypothetical protein